MGQKMNNETSYEVDLDVVISDLCEQCQLKRYHEAKHHDWGWDEPYYTCPASDIGEGDVEYEDGYFYCRQERGYKDE